MVGLGRSRRSLKILFYSDQNGKLSKYPGLILSSVSSIVYCASKTKECAIYLLVGRLKIGYAIANASLHSLYIYVNTYKCKDGKW